MEIFDGEKDSNPNRVATVGEVLNKYSSSIAASAGYTQGVSEVLYEGVIYTLNTDAVLQAARGNADVVDQTVLPGAGGGGEYADWVLAIPKYIFRSVSPSDYGYIHGGIDAVNANALKLALQHASDNGTYFVSDPGSQFRLTSDIFIDRSAGKALKINFLDADIICEMGGIDFGMDSSPTPTPYMTTSLTTEMARGDAALALTSVTGIEVGDLVEVLSPALSMTSVSTYHYYLVSEIDGNDVYIEATVVADVTAAQITASGQTGSIVVNLYKLAPPLDIENGNFTLDDPAGNGHFCIAVRQHSVSRFDACRFIGNGRHHINSSWNGRLDVGLCEFKDFGYLEKDGDYTSLPSAPSGLSFGYGVLTNRTCQTDVHNCTAYRGWHAVDAARGAMITNVTDCVFNRNSFGVNAHEGSWYVSVKNCVFSGNNGINLLLAAYGIVSGCEFNNMKYKCIVYGNAQVEVRIKNNKFNYNPSFPETVSAVYNADLAVTQSHAAGYTSVGYNRIFEDIGNTYEGQCRTYSGFAESNPSGKLVVKGNIYRHMSPTIYAMDSTTIEGVVISDVQSQAALVIVTGVSSPTICCANNTHTGGVGLPSNSALFYVTGGGAPNIRLINNTCDLAYLVRFLSNISINLVSGCANLNAQLFEGAGTVENAFNNNYKFGLAITTTVVNENNNNQIA